MVYQLFYKNRTTGNKGCFTSPCLQFLDHYIDENRYHTYLSAVAIYDDGTREVIITDIEKKGRPRLVTLFIASKKDAVNQLDNKTAEQADSAENSMHNPTSPGGTSSPPGRQPLFTRW